MEYENDEQVFNFISGLLLGAAIGAAVTLLTTPQTGKRTRRKIRRVAGDLRSGAGVRLDDLADEMKARVDDAVDTARKRLG